MDLKWLTEFNAPSGHEQALRRALLDELKGYTGVTASIDRMGNVVAVKEGNGAVPRKRVMLSGHMDEVGLIVTSATEDGFLRVAPVGGVDPRVIISKRVTVGDEKVPGIIGAMAIHLQSAADRERVLGYSDIYVDIGAKKREEAESKAPKGTYICFDTDYVAFGDGYVSAKALDDRVGVYNMLEVLRDTYDCDVICVFASQEETGCRGSKGAAFGLDPDVGIVLEGTTCNDLGDVPANLQVCNTGAGVCVSFMDGTSIANRDLFKKTIDVAEKGGLTYQVKRSVSGGNDGGSMQRARGGMPVVVLSVPCRYIHSPSSVIKYSDVESQLALTKALLKTF